MSLSSISVPTAGGAYRFKLKKSAYILLLLFAFAAAFCLPAVFLFAGGGLWHLLSGAAASAGAHAELFPNSYTVSKQGAFLRVPADPEISPQSGRDFLFLFWLNLRRVPAAGERLILLSKYAMVRNNQRGFALAIAADGTEPDRYRPHLFWGSENAGPSSGRWYDFPEIQLPIDTWVMFAISLHNDRYLGLHFGRRQFGEDSGESARLELLGGYELVRRDGSEDPGIGRPDAPGGINQGSDTTSADIIFGAASNRTFRGQIGPIAVVSGEGLERNITAALEGVLREPDSLFQYFQKDSVKLWTKDVRSDSSLFKHPVIFEEPQKQGPLRNRAKK